MEIDDNEIPEFDRQTNKSHENWTPLDVASYVLHHLPEQPEQTKNEVKDIFIKYECNGSKITDKDFKWVSLITEIVPFIQNLPPVELQRSLFHPLIEALFDIPNKLRDLSIWKTLLSFCRRCEKYDSVYKEEDGYWCHDRNGRPYWNPGSWRRYGFFPKGYSEEQIQDIMTNWHVAYHGTKYVNIDSIADLGLVPPGSVLPDGKTIQSLHGTAGGGGKAIYLTPSISYAAHWVYTSPTKVDDEYVYTVFQVRVKPGSFKVQGNTLWDEGWGNRNIIYDRRFGPDELEWIVDNADDIRVTGLMVLREKEEPKQKIKNLFQLHKELVAKPRGEGVGKWFWNCNDATKPTLDRNGPWKPYDAETNIKLEKAYMHYQCVCYLGNVVTELGTYNPYFIDFEKLEQIRCDNNKLRRAIKREKS
jgi:hypothetical protein